MYRRRRAALAILYCSIVAVAILAALSSPVFGVKRVTIAGLDGLRPEEAGITVQSAAFTPGANMFRAPLRTVEAKLSSLPWVRSATVHRVFPNAVAATVTPREAAALLLNGSGNWEIDPVGVPIRPATRLSHNLPMISLKRACQIKAGAPLADDSLRAAIEIYRSSVNQLPVRPAKIVVDVSGDICLNMRDGLSILMGQPEDMQTKIALVQRIYSGEPDIAGRLISVNLTCPSWPACVERKPAPKQTAGIGASNGASNAVTPPTLTFPELNDSKSKTQ